MASWVFHVDLDQFLVAVERLRRPDLIGLPVVVGGRGDPTERAVVSTASYEARAFGVRSGMALKLAVRKCPDAVFLPVDFPVYEAASAEVLAALREFPAAVVEPLGWDESFVGVDTDEPERTAREMQAAVLARSRLHSSIGIGDTLVRAKIATGFGKPQGIFRLTAANWSQVMGARPVEALWGIGKRTAERLARIGVHTVDQLGAAPEDALTTAFGPATGIHLGRLGRGEGRHTVDDTPWIARAHGRETTYQTDLTDPVEIAAALRTLAEAVVRDLHSEQRACIRVHLKVRFRPFFTFTRVRKLPEPTFDPAVITDTALELLQRLDDERPIRLLGIRGEMVPPEGGYDPPRTHGRRGGP